MIILIVAMKSKGDVVNWYERRLLIALVVAASQAIAAGLVTEANSGAKELLSPIGDESIRTLIDMPLM